MAQAEALTEMAEAQLNTRLVDKLQDVPLREHPDVHESIAQAKLAPPKLVVGPLQFQFDSRVTGTLQSFNSPDDVDESGIVGMPAAAGAEPTSLRPLLTVAEDRGYLKYLVTANVKSAAGVDIPYLKADAGGEVTALLGDYHVHSLGESMRQAVIQDLGNIRSVLEPKDLLRLAEHEALSCQVSGRLQAAVSMKWADVFASNLSLLSGIRANELVGIRTSLGATLNGSVSLDDDFVLIFTRPSQEERLRVAVRKGRARSTQGALDVGAKVEFANPAELAERLNEVVSGLAGKPMAWVDAAVERLGSLSAQEREVLAQVLERLGLDPALADPAVAKQQWEDFKQGLRGTIQQIAEAKLAAGFRYEYLRLAEDATLLQVTLPQADALAFHGPLIRGELQPLTQWMQAQSHEPEVYLHQESLAREQAWGFSLNLGRWELKSEDRKSLRNVVQHSFDGTRRRMAFLGVRSYEGITPNQQTQWAIDFKAETTRFSERPAAADFYYGLHFLTRYAERKLSENALRSIVDEAVAWQVLDDADERAVVSEFQGLVDRERLEMRLELKLDNGVMRALLTRAEALDVRLFARALARAMPWSPERPRAQAEVRRLIYAPIWELYFRETERQTSVLNPELGPRRTAELVASAIRNHGIGKELYLREKTYQEGGLFSFAEINQKNPGVVRKWQRFTAGMNHLRRAIAEGWNHEAIETAFEDLEELWQCHFHAKAVGAMLVELALALPEGLRGVERTLTVTRPGVEQLVFTTSRAAMSK